MESSCCSFAMIVPFAAAAVPLLRMWLRPR